MRSVCSHSLDSPTSRSLASSCAASETDEMKAGLHEVIRFAAPENDPSWLPSPHEENDWSFVGFPWLPAVDGTRFACISAPL